MKQFWTFIILGFSVGAVSAACAAEEPAAARINTERVNVRRGPGNEYERFALVDREARVKVTGRAGEWVQIRLPDGRAGWIHRQFVDSGSPGKPAQPPAAAPTTTAGSAVRAAAAPSGPLSAAAAVGDGKPASVTADGNRGIGRPAARLEQPGGPAALPGSPQAATAKSQALTSRSIQARPSPSRATDYSGTKPDPIAEATRESAVSAAGDGWRMMLYLLPMLVLTVLGIRGLKTLYERTGWLPAAPGGLARSARQAIRGSLNLASARSAGGSAIRVLESVPVGGVGLHLVEVRGRELLLGTAGGTVTLLTSIGSPLPSSGIGPAAPADFQDALRAAARELGEEDAPLGGMIGELDGSLREAREILAQRAARVRSWSGDHGTA